MNDQMVIFDRDRIILGDDPEYQLVVTDPEKLVRDLMDVLPEWRKANYERAKKDLEDAQSRLMKFGG